MADFADAADLIDLSGFGFANAAEARKFAANKGANVLFDFGPGDSLLVLNVDKAALTGADFIL